MRPWCHGRGRTRLGLHRRCRLCARRHSHGRRRRKRDLRHALFFWLMGVVITMAIIVPLTMWLLAPGMRRVEQPSALERFAADRFARVWDDPPERDALAHSAAETFGTQVRLRGPGGRLLGEHGPPCAGFEHAIRVTRGDRTLGMVEVCASAPPGHMRWMLGLLVVVGLLWAAAGRIARRLSYPLSKLARVARRIGHGDLQARSGLQRHRLQEVSDLATTIDDMAARVQRQLADQQELLAAVSHELRSPLSRMRVALEIARERGVDADLVARMQEEIISSDKLVGDMLASARLDFQGLTKQPVALRALIEHAARRHDLAGVSLCFAEAEDTVTGDPTLIARALDNLLDNARRHGRGVHRVAIHRTVDQCWIDVEDRGPGFDPAALPHVFESFYRRAEGGVQGLGLGLALVDRIARAHGGRARAENLPAGGARVGFCLPTDPVTG